MDETDKKLIEILRANSREPLVGIGKKLDLSESSVRKRIKSLAENGVIKKFTIEVGEGGSTKAIVFVSAESSTGTAHIAGMLNRIGCVQTVYEITGQYDIAVIMNAQNITEINASIDALRKIKGVTDTNTMIILRTVT